MDGIPALLSEAAGYLEFCHRSRVADGHYGPCFGGIIDEQCDPVCVYLRDLFGRIAAAGVELKQPL